LILATLRTKQQMQSLNL